jgi:hypothetical protein
MPFPSTPEVGHCRLIGTFYDSSGQPDVGVIVLTPTETLFVTDGYAVDPRAVVLPVAATADGVAVPIDFTAIATDNTSVSPSGWGYRVDYRLTSRSETLYTFAPAGTTVDLASISGTEPVPAVFTTVRTVNHLPPTPDGNVTIDAGDVSIPDATAVIKGKLQLAGDLGGTASAPMVPALAGKEVAGAAAALAGQLAPVAFSGAYGDLTGRPAIPRAPIVRHAYVTSGDVTLPNTGGQWQPLAGLELSLPASVGEFVEIGASGMRASSGNAFLDVGVVVGSGIVRYLATGTDQPAAEGDPAWYGQPNSYATISSPRGFVVQAGHLDGGNVRFVVAVRAAGSSTFFASVAYPFYWIAKNLGPVG